MSFIQWHPSYNVDIEIIDKQHQLLVKMINELYDAMTSGQDRETLGKLIKQLGVYAAMHFAREEHYFDMFGYPETDAHLKQHEDFEAKVADFEKDFDEGKQELSMEIMNFLGNWLVGHIKGTDQKYAPFLRERGVE